MRLEKERGIFLQRGNRKTRTSANRVTVVDPVTRMSAHVCNNVATLLARGDRYLPRSTKGVWYLQP